MHIVGVCGAWRPRRHAHEHQRLQDGVANLPEVVYRVYWS
jgi:hypothetical protein